MSNGDGTGLFENIGLVYKSYGGFTSFYTSGYTWLSVFVTGLCWRSAFDEKWTEFSLPILPTLAGFSIAAYAIYFSVLSEKERAALQAPDPDLGNRSPLLVMASGISHAVFIQIFAILMALVFVSKPFPTPKGYNDWADIVNHSISLFGLFLTIYGIILILASVFSIFRVLEIKSKLQSK